MDLENKIKQKLIIRGFTEKQLLNNRGLIGATIDEVALMLVKNLAIQNVSDMLCGSFDPENSTSSATKCKCGREKWEHPKPRN